MIETLFWLLVAHFVADYPLQTEEMGKYKNRRNQPIPPVGARPTPVWFAYLTAHSFVHAGLSALVVGVPFGFLIGTIHWIQDYLKCKHQYSPNIDQAIHITILVVVGMIFSYC